jgi:hypothetical protein
MRRVFDQVEMRFQKHDSQRMNSERFLPQRAELDSFAINARE